MGGYIPNTIEHMKENQPGAWSLTTAGGTSLLIFAARYKNAYYGAWFDLERLADILGLSERGREEVTLFTDTAGTVYYRNDGPQAESQERREKGLSVPV